MKNKNQINKIVSLYQQGLSAISIQKNLSDYSLSRIYQILKSARVTRSISNSDKIRFINKYPNITRALLVDLYITKQMSIPLIATNISIRSDIVRRLLLVHDITPRTIKEHLAIPKYRQALKHAISKIANTTKFKATVSKNSKKMWADRNYKASSKQLEIMHTEKYREKMRKITLDRHRTNWHDKIKLLISMGLSRCWRNNQEFRKKISSYANSLSSRVKENEELHKKWLYNLRKAMQNPEYRHKQSLIIKTLWKNQEYREKITKSSKKLWENPEYRKLILEQRINQPITSTQQMLLYDILDNLNISYIPEYCIGYFSFDCFLPNHNILIEVNGDYWHNLPKAIRNDKSKATYIEKYFPQFTLKYLWEHEFKCQDRIINLIKYWTKTDLEIKQFNFNEITTKQIDSTTAKYFLEKYHYTNKIGNNSIRIGYHINDELIALIIYGHVVRDETATRLNYKSKEVFELSRFAIHPLYQQKNLASYLISKSIGFIKTTCPDIKLLVSFADTSFNHLGIIYKASNWIFDGMVKPSYWYVDKDNYVMHKKTLWDHAMSLKLPEKVFAEKYGYTRIDGKEKLRFIYHLV